jgi:hypothetical protein
MIPLSGRSNLAGRSLLRIQEGKKYHLSKKIKERIVLVAARSASICAAQGRPLFYW